jgi:hypothetical protein
VKADLIPSFSFRKVSEKRLVLLITLCVIQIAALLYYVIFARSHGYLPSPFVYDKSNTFMDFFSPMYWADRADRYTAWGSVYPPLNFVFLKFLRSFLIDARSFAEPFDVRTAGGNVISFLVLSYFCVPAFVLTQGYWKKFSLLEKSLIYVCAVASIPMLFALERGNLILFALPFLCLLFSPVLGVRVMALAVLVNLKPYFVLFYFVLVVKRQWKELALASACAAALGLLTSALMDTNPLIIMGNLFDFTQKKMLFVPREVFSLPSSISAFSYVFSSDIFQNSSWFKIVPFAGRMAVLFEVVKWGVIAFAFIAMSVARDAMSQRAMYALILVMISNLGVSVGGYTFIFYLVLLPIFMEMKQWRIYIAALILIALPLDCLVLIRHVVPAVGYPSYISGVVMADVEWTLGAGSIIRPFVNLALLLALTLEFMRQKTAMKLGLGRGTKKTLLGS